MTLVTVDQVEGPSQLRQGEDLDPSKITVWGIYKDDSRKVVRINSSNITYDKNAVGPQTVRVRVSSREGSFETQVMALRSLSIVTPPSTVLYKLGQDANRTWPGIEVRGEWDEMGSGRVDIAACEVAGYNKDQAGVQTIRVSFSGMSTSFNVEVRAMASIRIAQPPTKVDYLQGETLDLAGLRAEGVWEGLPSENLSIAAGDVTGFNENTPGVQRLTITKNGRTAAFDVDVWRLTGIVLDRPPAKTDYVMGEQLVLSGIVVNANYAGSTAAKRKTQAVTVTQQMISGYNPNTIGNQQRVTVTVGGQVANFFVNVAPGWPPTTNQPSPVGRWRSSTGDTWTYNANGIISMVSSSGSAGDATWSTSGNRLTLSVIHPTTGEVILSFVSYYGITGNTLTIQLINNDGTTTDNPITTWTRQ
jgi:hypothetical protein